LFLLGRTIYRIITWDRLVKYEKANLMETNSGCKPPCWHGIIPGETNISEALSILEFNPKFNSLKRVFEDNEHGKNVSLRTEYFLIGGELGRLELENNIVKGITLTDQIEMSLSEVLDTFGLPLSVYPSPGPPEVYYWHISLYYPEKGLIVNIVTEEGSSEIAPSNLVYYIKITTEEAVGSRIEEVKAFQRKVKNPIVFPCPWKGYGDIYDLYEGSWW
jgi:hypothetical protein